MNNSIVLEFLEKHGKKEKENNLILKSRVNLHKKHLTEAFKHDANILAVKGGRGKRKRVNLMLKNLIVNFLLNCIRKYEYIDEIPFENEFMSKLNDEENNDYDDEEYFLTEDQIERINDLKKVIEVNIILKNFKRVEKLEKKIEDIKKEKKSEEEEDLKQKQYNNICQLCDQEMMDDNGMFLCTSCRIQGGAVQRQSYNYSGNISGSKLIEGMEKIGMIADNIFGDDWKQRTVKLIELYDDCLNSSEDKLFSVLESNYEKPMKDSIWSMMEKNKDKTLEFCKIELIKIILRELRRLNSKNIRQNLKYLKDCFNVRVNLSDLLDPEEDRKNIEFCLLELMNDKEKTLYNDIKNKIIRNKEFTNLTNKNSEHFSAITKFVLVSYRKGVKISVINDIIKGCGISFDKYSEHYNIIKKDKNFK